MGEERAKANGAAGERESSPVFVPLSELGASPKRVDFAAIRERLARSGGREYWRSLEQLSGSPEFTEYLQREFPQQAPRDMAPLPRREFFRLMGATLALAGVGGCAYQPQEHIIPYVQQPERLVPGKALYFNTAFPRGAYGLGVMAESQMGRPVKIEGNPQHPASLGSTDVLAQASILGLYDPDRSQAVRRGVDNANWDTFLGAFQTELAKHRANGGAGLRILMEPTTSPSVAAQMAAVLKAFPAARVCIYEPAGREGAAEGSRLAFGTEANPIYHLDRAKRILSLDSNFLQEEPGSVRYARNFIDGRRVREGVTEMNRLYVVEATPSITGANADHRLPVPPSGVEAVAREIAKAVGVSAATGGSLPAGVSPQWIQAVAKDLQSARGAALVIPGAHQPAAVHALAHAINGALGAAGSTVTYTAPLEARFPGREQTLKELADELRGGAVLGLVILGANPAYSSPADIDFAGALKAAAEKRKDAAFIHLSLYDDETSALCHWHLPEAHYLEAWGDIRAYDGTTSIIQPLIKPLYASRSALELLAILAGQSDPQGYDLVRGYWAGRLPAATFEREWHNVLLTGVIPNTAAPAITPAVSAGMAAALPPPQASTGMELIFRPDPHVHDGRYANNGWLQELPKPLTSLTWDNAALVSPRTAEAMHLANGEMMELRYRGRTLKVPVWTMVGHPDNSVSLYLGYGRTRAGRIGTNTGFNAYALRTSDAPWHGPGLEMTKTPGAYLLASTQLHFSLEGRDIVRYGGIEEYLKNPHEPEFMEGNEGAVNRDYSGVSGDRKGAGQEHGEANASAEQFAHESARKPSPSIYPQEWPSDRKDPGVGGVENKGPGDYQQGGGYNDQPMPAWGMVIDLNACIGCNTCTIACQAENNIATVGKDQVDRHRQMHWIRVDNYFEGKLENPDTIFQPVPCMHCEKAPCEPVCPVEATSHSAEGLNEMTYNRCVGTRYCSNNCPYKVRRFNFLQYSDHKTPSIQMRYNPDVTVRSRGVMEKCTYCVQRINEARIQAEKEERVIRDGDVVTACAQACPTGAIVFGNINDTKSNDGKGSHVRQLKAHALNFGVLTELNTRPRTTYMARLRNLNPELPRETEARP